MKSWGYFNDVLGVKWYILINDILGVTASRSILIMSSGGGGGEYMTSEKEGKCSSTLLFETTVSDLINTPL